MPDRSGTVLDLEAWIASGRRRQVRLGDRTVSLFTRVAGDGAWTTFWHGFPTSSWDWAPVADSLAPGRQRLYLDHLGFGASDKPREDIYSLPGQLDLARAIWSYNGVQETVLVAHDYSVSMVQELLARMLEGSWRGPEIRGALLLNGGLFYSRIEPRPIQTLLRNRWTGPLVSRLVTKGSFRRAMTRLWSQAHPVGTGTLDQMWDALTMHGGRTIAHRVARYLDEREANERRWTQALADSPVPLTFAWGLQDPVSGPAMVDGLRELGLGDRVVAWEDVGHYPQVEVPDRVADLVDALEAGQDPVSRARASDGRGPGHKNR